MAGDHPGAPLAVRLWYWLSRRGFPDDALLVDLRRRRAESERAHADDVARRAQWPVPESGNPYADNAAHRARRAGDGP